MLENLNRLLNNGFILPLSSAIATIVSIYFGIEQQETAKAIGILVVFFILLALFIYQRLNNAFKTDVNINERQKLNILLLYSEKENNTELINRIVGKHSSQNLNFVNFKIDIKDQNIFSNLEYELKSTDGIYCFWNEEIKNRYESYSPIIEKWLHKYEAKPFIVIANEDEVDEKVKNQYRIINIDGAENSLPILLSRSISRTKRFVSDAKTWRLAFIYTTLVLFSLLVCSVLFLNRGYEHLKQKVTYNELPYFQSKLLFEKFSSLVGKETIKEIPREEIIDYVNEYLELKQKQLEQILKDESLEISLWRSDSLNNTIHRKTRSSSSTKELPFTSVAGCACTVNQKSNSYIVGWKASHGKDVKYFWGFQSGLTQQFKGAIENCEYLEKPNNKEAIMSVAIRFTPIGRFNVICISSDFNDNMITDKISNEIVKNVLVELANLTSIIPNEVFDKSAESNNEMKLWQEKGSNGVNPSKLNSE